MGDSKTIETLALADSTATSPNSLSSTTICNSSPNVTAAIPSIYESYIDSTYVGVNVLGKREIINYSSDTKLKIATLSEELFQLKVKRIILLRKESELDYQFHDLILQEEYKQRSNAMMALANRKCLPSHNNSAETSADDEEVDDVTQMKEARLFNQMMDITSRRNQLLIDLDIERLREEEEENEIIEEHKQLQLVIQNLRQGPTSPTTTAAAVTAPLNGSNEPQSQIRTKNKRGRRAIKLDGCFLC